MKNICFCLLSLVLFSCKNEKEKVIVNDTTHKNAVALNQSKEDTLDNNLDGGKMAGNFIVDGIKFKYRVISTDSGYINIVEKFDSKKWIECLVYQHSTKENNILNDINSDGFTDISNEWRWASDIYLYNPKIKNFIKEPIAILNDFHELDTKEKIFYELSIFKSTQNGTNLFKIDDSKRIDLFSIDFIDDSTESSEDSRGIYDNVIIGYNLYKGNYLESYNCKLLKTVYLNKSNDFDYQKFWEENYKLLLASYP